MSNISDIIEQFIIETLEKEDRIELSRNNLAGYFSCVPSQINYVLNTRFTYDRGFVVESKRGGGGYITVIRLKTDNDYLKELFDELKNGIGFNKACEVLTRLQNDNIFSERESELIKASITDKALDVPLNIKERIRGSILKELISKAVTMEENNNE